MSVERQSPVHDRDFVDRTTGTSRDLAERATDVDLFLTMLRQAVHDAGWTLDALAEHLQVDKSYLSRMLNGEKPWRVEHQVALPDDIDALFHKRQAERVGLIVVAPVGGQQALENFVSGFVGLFAPQLPVRAERMARAELRTPVQTAKVGS